jgi:Tfp pilus assembly protein PilO
MKSLPKEKRERLILIGVLTLVVVVGIYFLMIKVQRGTLRDNAKKMGDLQQKIADAQERSKKADRFAADLAEAQKRLADLEQGMLPEGNEYIPMFNTLREAVKTSKVEFSDLNEPDTKTPLLLLPGFPYKCATFGNTTFFGYYHPRTLASRTNLHLSVRFRLLSSHRYDVLTA